MPRAYDVCHEILRVLFLSALQDAGGRAPRLRELRFEHNAHRMEMQVLGRFDVGWDAANRYHMQTVPEMALQQGGVLRRIDFREWTVTADQMWPREYESHFVREAMRVFDRTINRYPREMLDWDYGAQHRLEGRLRDAHRTGPQRRVLVNYPRLGRYEPDAAITPMEARAMMHEETMEEARARLAQDIEHEILRTMGLGRHADDAERAGFDVETLRAAAQALAGDPFHEDWRRGRDRERQADRPMYVERPVLRRRPADVYWHDDFRVNAVPAEREAARKKGMELLKANLTPKQRAQLEKNNYFDVRGGQTGKTYRIQHGTHLNVYELTTWRKIKCGWCFLPKGSLVEGDVMLAQKTALELFEEDALKVANKFG